MKLATKYKVIKEFSGATKTHVCVYEPGDLLQFVGTKSTEDIKPGEINNELVAIYGKTEYIVPAFDEDLTLDEKLAVVLNKGIDRQDACIYLLLEVLYRQEMVSGNPIGYRNKPFIIERRHFIEADKWEILAHVVDGGNVALNLRKREDRP